MGSNVADDSAQPVAVALDTVPYYVRRAQANLSSDYEAALRDLRTRAATLSPDGAAALYDAYQANLTANRVRATARIHEETPQHLDLNRFEAELIEQQQAVIRGFLEALRQTEKGSAVPPVTNPDRLEKILPQVNEASVAPLFAPGEEPEHLGLTFSEIAVEHHDDEALPVFTFRKKEDDIPPAANSSSALKDALSSVPQRDLPPEGKMSYEDLASTLTALEGEFIVSASSEDAPQFPIVSRARSGVSVEEINIEHIDMEPTHHGQADHEAEMAENGTHRWTPERLAEDEAKIREGLARFTGRTLQEFLESVLVPLRSEVLRELASRQQANADIPPAALVLLNQHLLSHADTLRDLDKQARKILRESPPAAPISAGAHGSDDSPPPPPAGGSNVEKQESSVLVRRSVSADRQWSLSQMLERGNDLAEALNDTIGFAQSVEKPATLKSFLADELMPEQIAVETELAKRRQAYGSNFDQRTYEEREFHLLQHAKFFGNLVDRAETEVAALEAVVAASSQTHSAATRERPIPTITEMIEMRNSIRRTLLEGGTETQLIASAIFDVNRALAKDPNNGFYKEEMKQLLAFQAEDQRRQVLENLRTEEIRVAQEAAAVTPSLRERLSNVFSRATSSLTETFTRATNSWRESFSLGRFSASFAKLASVAAVGFSLRGAVSSEANLPQETPAPSPVEISAEESPSALSKNFSLTSQKLRNAPSALREARAPQEESYARSTGERNHEPGSG